MRWFVLRRGENGGLKTAGEENALRGDLEKAFNWQLRCVSIVNHVYSRSPLRVCSPPCGGSCCLPSFRHHGLRARTGSNRCCLTRDVSVLKVLSNSDHQQQHAQVVGSRGTCTALGLRNCFPDESFLNVRGALCVGFRSFRVSFLFHVIWNAPRRRRGRALV